MSDVVQVQNDGHVRVIRMNRPEKKNAASLELAWGVIEAIRETVLDDDVWVVGLTGSGDSFCAGLDLTPDEGQGRHIPLTEQNNYLDELGWVSRFLLTLRQECDKPIVGGINGVAGGGGLSLAMATDIRIMAEGARFLAGYPRIGGSPDGGLSITLTQALGYEQAMRFLLENRTVFAAEAKELGMISEVVPDDQFEARFHEYLQSLTNLSPITGRATKRVLREATALDLDKQLRWELFNIGKSLGSLDGQEARRAFIEKRDPVFTGSTSRHVDHAGTAARSLNGDDDRGRAARTDGRGRRGVDRAMRSPRRGRTSDAAP